jgi:hypothetical protein
MKMKLVALAAAAMAMSGAAHAATTFTFTFDNGGSSEPDGTVTPPYFGTGTFTSPVNLTPGVYALTSLPGFTVNFTVGGANFTNINITTPISEVAVDVVAFGSGERLWFTENGSPADGGPYGGSLDLTGDGTDLTFEPSYYGGHNLYQSNGGDPDFLFGNYLALSGTPEPWTWSLMLLGLGAIGAALRGRREVSAATA